MTPSVLERPNTNNYFLFYGLEEKYELDKTLIKNCYLEKSKLYHPDFYGDDAQAQNIAIASSAYNNLAYKTLSNDIRRAQYLLDLKLNQSEQSKQLPQDFLMDMMDINERIDELEAGAEAKIIQDIQNLKTQLMENIHTSARAEQWMETQIALLKWKYIERLENRLQS